MNAEFSCSVCAQTGWESRCKLCAQQCAAHPCWQTDDTPSSTPHNGHKSRAILFLVTNSPRYINGILRALASLPHTFTTDSQTDIILFHADLNQSVLKSFHAIQPDVLLHSVEHLFREDQALQHPSIQRYAIKKWNEGIAGDPWVNRSEMGFSNKTEFAGCTCPLRSSVYH